MKDSPGALPHALYLAVWRWHFFAGLFVAPVLIMLAVTGGLYLFKNELEGAWYGDLVHVRTSQVALPASVQEQTVLTAYPGAEVLRYVAPIAPDRAAEWRIATRGGEALTAFVDPASARLQGALGTDTRLSEVLSTLHGELMLGRFGDTFVELAACWTFLLLVSGLFLWWPRRWRLAGVLVPRVGARGRAFWRDMHAVPAVWNAGLVGFLILSGLPWSGFFGERLSQLGTLSAATTPTPNFAPEHFQHADHDTESPERADLPWVMRHAAAPTLAATDARIGIDRVMQEAHARGLDRAGLSVFYPEGPTGVFTLSFVPDEAQGQRTVYVRPDSGDVVADIGWNEYSPLGKAVELGVEIHVGRQFGLLNRLVLALSCFMIVCTVATGFAMWWLRRPSGVFGAPPAPVQPVQHAGVVAAAGVLGVLFPLVGASMLGVLACGAVVPRLRRAAGFAPSA